MTQEGEKKTFVNLEDLPVGARDLVRQALRDGQTDMAAEILAQYVKDKKEMKKTKGGDFKK